MRTHVPIKEAFPDGLVILERTNIYGPSALIFALAAANYEQNTTILSFGCLYTFFGSIIAKDLNIFT